MNNYILKINKKFISLFKTNVQNQINALLINSDKNILKIIFKETNKLIGIMSTRSTSVNDIPKLTDYPSSTSINKLTANLEVDFYKLYESTNYIHNDTQNLLTYNAIEREGITRSLAVVQDKIMSSQTKTKKDISVTISFKETFKTDILTDASTNVSIDTTAGTLTLKVDNSSSNNSNNINYQRVTCGFIDDMPSTANLYPGNNQLSLGSKLVLKPDTVYHNTNRFKKATYLKGLGNEGTSPILTTQFESILTFSHISSSNYMRSAIESHISDLKGIPTSFIVIDELNSLSGKYMNTIDTNDTKVKEVVKRCNDSKIKIMIPFNTPAVIINAIRLNFLSNENETPIIDISNSFVYDNNNRKIGLISDASGKVDNANLGEFKLCLVEPCFATYAEIVISYPNNFHKINNFYLTEYVYDMSTIVTIKTADNKDMSTAVSNKKYIYIEKDTGVTPTINKNKVQNILASKEVK